MPIQNVPEIQSVARFLIFPDNTDRRASKTLRILTSLARVPPDCRANREPAERTNDYEEIGGHEQYRADLTLMYFVRMDPSNGRLVRFDMTPMQIRRIRGNRASEQDARWLRDTLHREGFGTRVVSNDSDPIKKLSKIKMLVEASPEEHRFALSKRVCKELSWVQPNGRLKDRSCRDVLERPDIHPLSFEERLGLLVDRELTERDNRRFKTRLRQATLRLRACEKTPSQLEILYLGRV